jgi:hypothetical protein
MRLPFWVSSRDGKKTSAPQNLGTQKDTEMARLPVLSPVSFFSPLLSLLTHKETKNGAMVPSRGLVVVAVIVLRLAYHW